MVFPLLSAIRQQPANFQHEETMIHFKNKGKIDPRAITIMGASVKKENSIGFFGTGLKYAIAICLRNGLEISIFSGNEKFEFSKKPVNISGVEFDVVTMNGQELGFTTQQGKTWELWQAFRELYCNCIDEGGEGYSSPNQETCGDDETLISVTGKEFQDIFENLELFICLGNPNIQTESADIFLKPSSGIFYKTVLVKEKIGMSLLTYNIKKQIDLTEDRTAKYDFQVRNRICHALSEIEDDTLLERVLSCGSEFYEGKLDFDIHQKPSETFLNVCARLSERKEKNLNPCALQYAQKHANIKDSYDDFELSAMQKSMLERADSLLLLAGFNANKYPRRFVKKMGLGTLALAQNGTVYISEDAFLKGTKLLAHALIEENWHLEFGYEDETRAFQTFLFDNILTLIERLNQEAF